MAVVPSFAVVEKPGFSALLDHVRWLSAFAVLCGHARNTLFQPYAWSGDLGPAGQAFYVLTNLQNEAVVCFFVISGPLIGGKLLEYVRRPVFPLRRYVIDRLARLYVVFIPALALTFGVALLGDCDGGDVTAWLGAVFHLQHILVPNIACNLPIWSLANEFWYYALGLLAALAWRGSRVALGVAAAIVALLLAADSWNSQNVLLYLPFWALGTAVFWWRGPVMGPWPAFGLFVAALLISRSHVLDGVFWLRDGLIALGLAGFLVAASSAEIGVRLARWGRRLSGFSFTLYLTHWPLLALYTDWLVSSQYPPHPLSPGQAVSYGVFAGALVFCLVFAALLARVTEAKTARVREFIDARIRF